MSDRRKALRSEVFGSLSLEAMKQKKIEKKKQKVKQDKQHRHNSEGGTVYVAIYCN